MKRISYIFAGILVMTIFSQAQEYGSGTKFPHAENKGNLKERFENLDLSPEQRIVIKDIRTEFKKDLIPLQADIEMKRMDLEQAFNADNPDREQIMKLIEDITDLQLEIRKCKADMRLKIHVVLSPEQREQLKQ